MRSPVDLVAQGVYAVKIAAVVELESLVGQTAGDAGRRWLRESPRNGSLVTNQIRLIP